MELPIAPDLSADQAALLQIMHPGNSHYVEEWRTVFQGAMVRATTSKGRKVTIHLYELEALISAGLIVPGYGGSFALTERGKAIA